MNTKQQLQLVTFEQAKRLKEAGFDWRVILLDNEYSFPTVALALKWFRDVKGIYGYVDRNLSGWYWVICNAKNGECVKDFDLKEELFTYKLSEISLLDRLLTLIEKES